MIDVFQAILLVPTILFLAILISTLWGAKKQLIHGLSKVVGLSGLAAIAAGIYLYSEFGSQSYQMLDWQGIGFSLRIDALSLIMYSMVLVIAYVVLKYSLNYMAGDHRFQRFLAMYSVVATSVLVLTISGNLLSIFLTWVLASVGLQQLLKLYPGRKKAIRAAKVKFVIARLADVTLLLAFILLYKITGTADLNTLLFDGATIRSIQASGEIELISVLLVLTAALKSVQFPFHTWLKGVLEAPTPVSALLHAGLLNAGPFLIIRFSPIFIIADNASALLITMGGLSAIFGSLVYITQSSIKTGLVYSSVGHMGFSLMLCGFGLYSAALLHLVSHSFYKAYSFLRSGSVVDDYKAMNVSLYQRTGHLRRVLIALVIAVMSYLIITYTVQAFGTINAVLVDIGYVILLGVFALLTYSIDTKNYFRVGLKATGLAVSVLTLFYLWEVGIEHLVHDVVPSSVALSPSQMVAFAIILTGFTLATFLQAMVTVPAFASLANSLRVHLRNGLYIDSIYARIFKV